MAVLTAELTFSKTSGTVTEDREKNWPIADQHVTSNDPRSNCGIPFARKVANAKGDDDSTKQTIVLRFFERSHSLRRACYDDDEL